MKGIEPIPPTPWFAFATYSPVRSGWYEVQLASGATAFAKYEDGDWTDTPDSAITHWRGLSEDPSTFDDSDDDTDADADTAQAQQAAKAGDADADSAAAEPSTAASADSVDAEATATEGVRAAWNAFFPALGDDKQKPLGAAADGKTTH